MDFEGTMGTKSKEYKNSKWILKKSFCWCSNVMYECIYHKRLGFLEKQDWATRIRDWGPIHDNFFPFL